jgi:hypothetical protein
MNKKYFLLIIVSIILVSAIILRIKAQIDDQNALSKIEKNTVASVAVIEDSPEAITQENKESELEKSREVDVLISNPQSNQLISSPVLVQGKISGAWFFEASLPIRLIDENNIVIAESYATAEDDWMTEELVLFSGVLEFSPEMINSDTGYLLILKDNPSGLPENEGVIRMPIRFK